MSDAMRDWASALFKSRNQQQAKPPAPASGGWGDRLYGSRNMNKQATPTSRGGARETWRQSSSYDVYGKKLFAKEGGLRYDLFTGERNPSQPLNKLTIGQVMTLQKQRTNTAAGAYQFTLYTLQDTMKDAGLKESDMFDERTQYKLFETFTRKNEEHARQAVGKDTLNDAERYSLHFLGRSGGTKFLKLLQDNPSANFAAEFGKAFRSNRALVDKVGGRNASVSDVFKELAVRMK